MEIRLPPLPACAVDPEQTGERTCDSVYVPDRVFDFVSIQVATKIVWDMAAKNKVITTQSVEYALYRQRLLNSGILNKIDSKESRK